MLFSNEIYDMDNHEYDTPVFAVGDLSLRPVFRRANPPSQGEPRLHVNRPVFDQPRFDAAYQLYDPGPPLNPLQRLKQKWHTSCPPKVQWRRYCSGQYAYHKVKQWFPVVEWLPKYDWRADLLPDVITGITVAFVNTPEGVAHALMAACPGVTGLYTSFFPLLTYFFMTTTRHCTLGSAAIASVMTSKLVLEHAHFAENESGEVVHPEYELLYNGTQYTVAQWSQVRVGAGVALLIGLWQLFLGCIGAGALMVYFSDQLIQGFTCGASIHIITSQLPELFGVHGLHEHHGAFKLLRTYLNFFQVINTVHATTVIISFLSLLFLAAVKLGINSNPKIMKVIKIQVPAELLLVVGSTGISYAMDLHGRYEVKILGQVPNGLPMPALPDISFFGSVLTDTFAIAAVTLYISQTLGLLFANKHEYPIDPNQEFKAQGIGNIFGSFFQCFPSSVSVACSAVQEGTGGRTQMVQVVQCLLLLVVIVALGKFLEPLPHPVLGAIVIVSVVKLATQVIQLYALTKLSWVDWSIFVAVFLGTILLDVDYGLAVGLGWAVLTIMLRLQKPKVGSMGRLPGTDIYQRTDQYILAAEVPGVKIVRVDAPIYYANAAYIKQRFYAFADLNNLLYAMRKLKPPPTRNVSVQNTLTPTSISKIFAFADRLDVGEEEAEEDAANAERRKSYTYRRESQAFRRDPDTPAVISLEDYEDLQRENGSAVDRRKFRTRHLIVDCSNVPFVDVTGAGFLKKTQMECAAVDVEVLLACTSKAVRDTLYICGTTDFIPSHQYFVTIHDAVLYALNAQKLNPAGRLIPDRNVGTNMGAHHVQRNQQREILAESLASDIVNPRRHGGYETL